MRVRIGLVVAAASILLPSIVGCSSPGGGSDSAAAPSQGAPPPKAELEKTLTQIQNSHMPADMKAKAIKQIQDQMATAK